MYVVKREAKELIATIAAKCNFDPTSILHIVKIIQHGASVKVDDDIVHCLPKYYNMVLDLSRVIALSLRHEWNNIADTTFNSEDVGAVLDAIQSEGYLLKLIF